MGGKGGGESFQIPQNNQSQDIEQMMALMMGMQESMGSMMEAMAMSNQAPTPAPAPPIESAPAVDWEAKLQELNAQATQGYQAETDRKINTVDTIHTSPLLDEEEDVAVTTTPLGGK